MKKLTKSTKVEILLNVVFMVHSNNHLESLRCWKESMHPTGDSEPLKYQNKRDINNFQHAYSNFARLLLNGASVPLVLSSGNKIKGTNGTPGPYSQSNLNKV